MGIRDKEWVRRKGQGFIIPSSRIRVGPWGNARTDITPEMVETKALSLIKEGQKKAVKGLLSEDGEWFELTDGEVRHLGWNFAKKQLCADLDEKLGGMYCELEEGFTGRHPTTIEAIRLQLSYGTDSEPLSQYDKAAAVKKLLEAGDDIEDLAVIMHCSKQHIKDLRDIDSAPAHVKKAVKPTGALKYERASPATKKAIDKKISDGEKVKCKDIPPKSETRERTVQERAPIEPPVKRRLSDDEVREQIQKCTSLIDRSKKGKDRFGYQQLRRGLMIPIGEELPL